MLWKSNTNFPYLLPSKFSVSSAYFLLPSRLNKINQQKHRSNKYTSTRRFPFSIKNSTIHYFCRSNANKRYTSKSHNFFLNSLKQFQTKTRFFISILPYFVEQMNKGIYINSKLLSTQFSLDILSLKIFN